MTSTHLLIVAIILASIPVIILVAGWFYVTIDAFVNKHYDFAILEIVLFILVATSIVFFSAYNKQLKIEGRNEQRTENAGR